METIVEVFSALFGNTVTMLQTLQVPLLGISFWQFWLSLGLVSVGFIVLRRLFGIGGGGGEDYSGGNNKSIKISSERKGDRY